MWLHQSELDKTIVYFLHLFQGPSSNYVGEKSFNLCVGLIWSRKEVRSDLQSV